MFTPIKLDKERTLRYRMKALSLVEEHFGKPLAQIDFNNLFIKDAAYLLWAGLVHEDKDLTFDQLFDILDSIDDMTLLGIQSSIYKAVGDAYGPAEVVEDENPKMAAAVAE